MTELNRIMALAVEYRLATSRELDAPRTALRAELERLEQDAARYRWLRNGSVADDPAVYADDDCNTWLHGEALDAAIDAAME